MRGAMMAALFGMSFAEDPVATRRFDESKASLYGGACTLFNNPGENYAGGNVIGFSTSAGADACCSSCATKAGCAYYNFRSSDKGCTLYSTATGAKKTVAGDACGSKNPPPAPLPTHPDDSPCVKWIPFTSHTPISSADTFVTSILTTVLGACNPSCYCASTIGNVLPCFASDPGIDVFGHHDWLPGSNLPGLCIAAKDDHTIFGHNQFMAGKGPDWEKFQWKVTQQGATVPSNAIKAGNRALGRSTQNVPNPGCGHGYTGWIDINSDGTLGPLQYAVASGPQNSTGSFEIAYCHSCKLCPKVYNASFHPGPGCPNCTKPVHPPPPPPPLSTNPCIRFGHAIPVTNHVDAMIVQDSDPSISHTWTNFKFSDFSDWVNVFKPGTGTITIWENAGGKRGDQLYQLSKIPLTPGPLVVVIKVAQSQAFNSSGPEPFWPPRVPDNVETIAASYVQPGAGGKVRLFNLSPDTKVAGMSITSGTAKVLAKNVQYSLGSSWFPVPVTAQTYSFSDDLTNKVLATRVETPPPNPLGFSNVLIGLQHSTGITSLQVIPLVDAPEGGVCKP